MSGFTRLTGRQIERYLQRVDGLPDDPEERLAMTGFDWYRDAHGGLHVRCDRGRLWEILSGKPNLDIEQAPADGPPTEWLTQTDLGAAISRSPLPPATVLRLLRRAGLLERVDGQDRATEAAAGLYDERPLGDNWSSTFHREPPSANKVQRRWAFEVIARLKALPPDDKPPRKRRPTPMTEGQAAFLQQLCEQAAIPFNPTLSKAEASEQIDALIGR